MAKAQALNVQIRESHGRRRNRRLRNGGSVPAVLYGHKKESLSLSLAEEEIAAIVRGGNRFVALQGAVNEKAFIKECQWDTWGNKILHIDFARVSEHEKVRVTVPVELRGESPGTKDGGVVKHTLHTVDLECEAAAIPDKIEVNINHLAFNQTLHVSDLVLPPGVRVLVEPTLIVVNCSLPVEVSEETASAGDDEPEVIGRKKAEEEADAE
jgi:large subunit ribosomal protein L25